MLEFNEDKKILYAYKNGVARPNLRPDNPNKSVRESFLRYINGKCQKDVTDIFMPALLNVLKEEERMINIKESDIVIKQIDPGMFNDRTYHVTALFSLYGYDMMKPSDVTVMQLPSVDENGIIEFDSKQYAFIHMLEQEPAISYESNEAVNKPATLKIKNGTRSIWIDDSNGKLKFRMSDRAGKSSKTKYTLIDLISAMASTEGYDIDKLWSEFANFSIVNMFKDEMDKSMHLYYMGANTSTVNAIDYINELVPRLNLTRLKYDGTGDISYSNVDITDNLNNLLSLDRAVGEVLAKDVYSVINPSRKLAEAGTTVDNSLLMLMKAEGVYNIYVKYIPNLEGYYLAENVIINYAPPGLKITQNLREHFPEEKGMYTSRFYEKMSNPIIYEEGEVLTSDMINTIVAFGKDSILITDKKTGGSKKTLNFYEEIMSNRQFLGEDIGLESGKWYYLDKDNNYVETNGAYTTYDFMALHSFCVKLFGGKWVNNVNNSDIGFRKILVTLEEQYHRAFCYAVREGFKQMNRKFKTIYTNDRHFFLIRDRIDNEFYPFHKNFWKYLRDEAKCIVPLQSDNVHNPIAYQSACTKVNVYTANKHSVADSQREIAIGSYGKIDPYEIPQSGKMGTVYNATCGVKIDEHGKMSTPYYKIIKHSDGNKVLLNKPYYFTSEEEENIIVADICSVKFDEKTGVILNPDDIVLCRVPTYNSIEKQTFAQRRVSDVMYINANATQSLSWATATIPSMGSNDAARAIFAVAQEKAAKGLVEPEEPDYMTSAYEQYVWLNDKFGIVAKKHGFVDYITYNWRIGEYTVGVVYDGQDGDTTGTRHVFKEYFNSGYSVTKLKVLVKKGQELFPGDMIASSNFISDRGILQFGRNALVGFICTGYNYEDGCQMSLSFSDKLSSYRINEEEFSSNPNTTKSYNIDTYPCGVYMIPGETTVRANYSDTKFMDKCKKTLPIKKAYGFYEESEPLKSKHKRGNYGVLTKAVSVDTFKTGDKASNRHGNKGVASTTDPKVVDDSMMPRLANGMPLDICNNPLGVGSRMNMGQVKECHIGLIAHVLGIKISADAYNPISEDEIRTLMSLTVDLMNSKGDISQIINSYSSSVPSGLLKFCQSNIDWIRTYAGCFNKNGTTRVMLPGNNGKMTETEILVGYIYVFKLIQESYKKIHARAGETMGEPYGEVSDAPTHGSSKAGGQRFGTMEMDALCAYGTSAYIQELTNERCDNAIARNNFYVNTYLPPNIRKDYLIEGKGQRRSTTQFLYTLLALGLMAEPDDGEFLPLSYKNGEELAHWKPSVIQRASRNFFKEDKKPESDESLKVSQDAFQNARDLVLGKLF